MTTINLNDFESYRPLMFSIAYRMLGSATEAEDIVQEAYLRNRAAAPGTIQSPKAFLSTIVTRLCLNQLQSARVQRETYIGPWLPEPIFTETDERANPQHRALRRVAQRASSQRLGYLPCGRGRLHRQTSGRSGDIPGVGGSRQLSSA